jgi:hypothetical protein
MSKQREARDDRRRLRERIKLEKPLKVVPSKKGLATAFAIASLFGFVFGIAIYTLKARFFHG